MILHVEDDEADRLLTRAAFARMTPPVEVQAVVDGQAAIDWLSSHPAPRLVLLDLKLPRRSGFEVLEWIRRQPALGSLPVFVLTSSEEPGDIARATALGANTYLVKNVDIRVQRELVRGICTYLAEGGTDVSKLDRRTLLMGAAAMAVPAAASKAMADDDPDFKIKNGRIKQSIMGWTYAPMPVPELAKHCKDLGMHAMEGVDAKFYPMIKELGLKIALTGSHGFKDGPCDPAKRAMVVAKIKEGIDKAVEFGAPSVITFTGYRVAGLTDEAQNQACIEAWKEVMPYAEEKKINVCLEHLNSRDTTHAMKGHPGYFGDHVQHCVDLIKAVGSPRMKLLFDIYHVQIMDGDVIRHLRQYKDVIGHYHTAGVPGRGELDDTQELNYPPIIRAILETGYEGFLAQEFIPTWPDRVKALRHAVRVCDV